MGLSGNPEKSGHFGYRKWHEHDNHIVWMKELQVWYKSGSLFYGRYGEKKVICVVLFSHCREKARNSQLLLEARSFLFFMVATKLVSRPPSSSSWRICLGRNIWQALGTGSVNAQNRFVELSTPHEPIKGTPLYLAPDCFFHAASVNTKVDVWSLGLPLAEINGGHVPPPFASSHTAFCYNLKPASL